LQFPAVLKLAHPLQFILASAVAKAPVPAGPKVSIPDFVRIDRFSTQGGGSNAPEPPPTPTEVAGDTSMAPDVSSVSF
jgi:hypothetical protein